MLESLACGRVLASEDVRKPPRAAEKHSREQYRGLTQPWKQCPFSPIRQKDIRVTGRFFTEKPGFNTRE